METSEESAFALFLECVRTAPTATTTIAALLAFSGDSEPALGCFTTATEWRNALLEWECTGLVARLVSSPTKTRAGRVHVLDEVWCLCSPSASVAQFQKRCIEPLLKSLRLHGLASVATHRDIQALLGKFLASFVPS
jgi:hypothetical protein